MRPRRMHTLTGLLSIGFALALFVRPISSSSSPPSGSGSNLLVHTTSGLVQGFLDTTTTDVPLKKFLGVPFAADTSGANRWRPPQPVKVTPGKVINATAFGPACMQGRYVLHADLDFSMMFKFAWAELMVEMGQAYRAKIVC